MDTPTNPLLKTKRLMKKAMVAQITNIKSADASHRQIRQILLSPINTLVRYEKRVLLTNGVTHWLMSNQHEIIEVQSVQ